MIDHDLPEFKKSVQPLTEECGANRVVPQKARFESAGTGLDREKPSAIKKQAEATDLLCLNMDADRARRHFRKCWAGAPHTET